MEIRGSNPTGEIIYLKDVIQETIMNKKGKKFEIAVYEFVKALTPNSQVFFDHTVPDKDTGALRQTDAWVQTTFAGHIPLSILVSCKNYKRKLNISHIETFISEIVSTSASTGIIYSSSGFSPNALKKAKAYGINCCQLFTGRPSPLPETIVFHSYVCKPRIALEINADSKDMLNKKDVEYWDELFRIHVKENLTALDAINKTYISAEKEAMAKNDYRFMPSPWISTFCFSDIKDENTVYSLTIKGIWAIFKGKTECHLFNGSYCFNNNSYLGNMRTPAIDTYEFHPGTDFWEEVKNIENLPKANMVAIFGQGDIKTTLTEHFKGKKF